MSGRLECNIVKDLLPLYKDNVVSEKTAEQIEEHLRTCESCMEEYQSMNQELSLDEVETPKGRFEETFAKYHKEQTNKSFRNLMILAIVFIVGAVGIGYIKEQPVKKVSEDRIHIMQAYEVEEDGQQEFFIYYELENTKAPFKCQIGQISGENGVAELDFMIKEPFFASEYKENELYGQFNHAEAFLIEAIAPITELYYAGELIWSEDEQEDVPEYAKVMLELFHGNSVYRDGNIVPGCSINIIDQTISIYQSEVWAQNENVELGIWSLEDGTKIK